MCLGRCRESVGGIARAGLAAFARRRSGAGDRPSRPGGGARPGRSRDTACSRDRAAGKSAARGGAGATRKGADVAAEQSIAVPARVPVVVGARQGGCRASGRERACAGRLSCRKPIRSLARRFWRSISRSAPSRRSRPHFNSLPNPQMCGFSAAPRDTVRANSRAQRPPCARRSAMLPITPAPRPTSPRSNAWARAARPPFRGAGCPGRSFPAHRTVEWRPRPQRVEAERPGRRPGPRGRVPQQEASLRQTSIRRMVASLVLSGRPGTFFLRRRSG